jgi:transketolase
VWLLHAVLYKLRHFQFLPGKRVDLLSADRVLPPAVRARVAVEQASTFGWERYIGLDGRIIGMKTFGASAPLKELQRKFGFHPDEVVLAAKELLGKK